MIDELQHDINNADAPFYWTSQERCVNGRRGRGITHGTFWTCC